MGNHELSPLDAICVAPVYMAAWAQEHLGGRFGPEKKYLAPPPPKKKIPRFHSPGPSASPPGKHPLLVGFSIKNRSPQLLAPRAPPSPCPSRKKIKIYPKRPPRHASSETCLMASSYRKRCALLGLIRGKHLPRGSMLS